MKEFGRKSGTADPIPGYLLLTAERLLDVLDAIPVGLAIAEVFKFDAL